MTDDFDYEDPEDFEGDEDFDELDEVVGDSNAGAYQKAELRQGPPLEYVAEKVRRSLEQLHHLTIVIKQDLADSDELDGLDEPLVLPPPLVLCLLVPRLSLM